MAAVSAKDQILGDEIGTHSYRDRLFAHIQMDKSGKPGVPIEFLHFELKQPELEHFPVIAEEQIRSRFAPPSSFPTW